MKPERYICKEDSERFYLSKGKEYFPKSQEKIDDELFLWIVNDVGSTVLVKASRFDIIHS